MPLPPRLRLKLPRPIRLPQPLHHYLPGRLVLRQVLDRLVLRLAALKAGRTGSQRCRNGWQRFRRLCHFTPPPGLRPGRRTILAGLALAGLLLAAGAAMFSVSPPSAPAVATVVPPAAPAAPAEQVVNGTVRSGQTLSTLLAPYLSGQQIHSLSHTALTAGHSYRLIQRKGRFVRFEHDINDDYQLVISNDNGRVRAAKVAIPYTVTTKVVSGTVSSSLFEAVAAAGETDPLAVALADVFACDVDFIRDLRQGDAFKAYVEKRLRDGKPAGYGHLLAAEFTNDGKTYKAFRYQDGKKAPAYYDQNGNSLRKALLRAPLPFSRVSSGFTMRRFHPIAKTWRAHPAIDYAAPTGTPIMAVGDATVIARGYSDGNGNFVKLRHSGGLETMYLHMSRIAGIGVGQRVRQGQTIGFVGSTGLATGPHLCYRMTRNGAPVNPAKIPTTPGEPIARGNLAAFRAAIEPLIAQLKGSAPPVAEAAGSTPKLASR